jgi:inactivated superfamily I helicase
MTGNDEYAKLSEDRCEVDIYPEEDLAEEWRSEAEEQNSSLSQYLQKLINEARSYREHGLVGTGDTGQKRIQELEEKVQRLEKRLEQKESESTDSITFDPETLKEEVLTQQYQSLEEVIRGIIESGMLDDALRTPVENQLYFLAAQDLVEYERGWGWKLVNGGDE